MAKRFEILDQVAFIPWHADDNQDHVDVEYGFVTKTFEDSSDVFVRYWHKHEPGRLRTTSNSERTGRERLIHKESVPTNQIAKAIKQYDIKIG